MQIDAFLDIKKYDSLLSGFRISLVWFTGFWLYSVDKCVDRKTKPHYFERWENSLENVKYWHKQEWFLILEKL